VERVRYLALKYDVVDSKEKTYCKSTVKVVDLSEDEVKHLLEAEALMTTGNSKVLRRRCQTHNLPTTRSITTDLVPHWMGQAKKGLMQICISVGWSLWKRPLLQNIIQNRERK